MFESILYASLTVTARAKVNMVQLEVVRAITALKHQYTCQRYEPGQ